MAEKNIILPVHIGFIMDGNGRWAKKRGMPRTFGHREGAKAFRRITEYCNDIGVKYITFYAFSTENWSRPKEEVDAIMKLFKEYLLEAKDLTEKNIRLVFLGDKSRFDTELRNRMTDLEDKSRDHDGMTVALAMNYGGRDDIVYAVKNVVHLLKENKISEDEINEDLITRNLYTGDIPDADLIIRPSGEKRLSNFLIWQSSYAEFYFTDVLWPDFGPRDLDRALEDYASRGRRFGGV